MVMQREEIAAEALLSVCFLFCFRVFCKNGFPRTWKKEEAARLLMASVPSPLLSSALCVQIRLVACIFSGLCIKTVSQAVYIISGRLWPGPCQPRTTANRGVFVVVFLRAPACLRVLCGSPSVISVRLRLCVVRVCVSVCVYTTTG